MSPKSLLYRRKAFLPIGLLEYSFETICKEAKISSPVPWINWISSISPDVHVYEPWTFVSEILTKIVKCRCNITHDSSIKDHKITGSLWKAIKWILKWTIFGFCLNDFNVHDYKVFMFFVSLFWIFFLRYACLQKSSQDKIFLTYDMKLPAIL